MISHILIGFEVFDSDFESFFNDDCKKILSAKIFKNYPADFIVIDSKFDYYISEVGNFLIYTCILSYNEKLLIPKIANSKINDFRITIESLITSYLNSKNVIYKLS